MIPVPSLFIELQFWTKIGLSLVLIEGKITSDQLKLLYSLTVLESLTVLKSLTVLESLTVSDSLLQFGPELVLVSAGFDAALGDPLVCEPAVTVTVCVYY